MATLCGLLHSTLPADRRDRERQGLGADKMRVRWSTVRALAVLVGLSGAGSAVGAVAPDLVVPATSGTFTVSHLLPRQAAPARSNCPWDEPGLSAFPPGDEHSGDVVLAEGTKYLLSHSTTIVGTLTVPAGAELIFADEPFELIARGILVQDGRLRIGSPSCRTSARHTITLTGSRSDSDSADIGHKGIVVTGAAAAVDMFGALHQPSWSRLAKTALAGTAKLYLQECVR